MILGIVCISNCIPFLQLKQRYSGMPQLLHKGVLESPIGELELELTAVPCSVIFNVVRMSVWQTSL